MWRSNKNHILNEKLDCCGEDVFRSLELSEVEINNAANSPFLYRRIRVRIEEEERRRTKESNPWQALLMTARRAIPAFLMASVIAIASSWYVHWHQSSYATMSQNPIIGDVASLSNDEEIESIVGWDENKAEVTEERR